MTDNVAEVAAHRLRLALEATADDSPLSIAARHDIIRRARLDPTMSRVLDDYLLDAEVLLDLHLDGAGVLDHSTRARDLGLLMTRASEAVKEIAKNVSGKKRYNLSLLTTAASEGSVRVVFKSPPLKKGESPGLAGTGLTDQLDALALKQFAAFLAQAESEDGPIEASVQELRGPARRAMRLVARTVIDSHWTIDGSVVARGLGRDRFSLTAQGAARLALAASQENSETRTQVVAGSTDGWTWSDSTMRFVPDSGRPFNAAVPQALESAVALANADRDNRVLASFRVTTTYPKGDAGSGRNSYLLLTLQPLTTQALLSGLQMDELPPTVRGPILELGSSSAKDET